MMSKRKNFKGTLGKRFLAAGLVAVLGLGDYSMVSASKISDANDKKKEAESKLNSVQENINDIENKQSDLQNEIDSLQSELVDLIVNMEVLAGELDNKKAEVKQVKKDLKGAEADVEKQYEDMKVRLCYMYKNGDTSLLEAIVGSEGMSDMLNRVEYVTSVYDYDKDLLADYKEAVQKVEELKTQKEQEKAELEEMQSEYEAQEVRLEEIKSEKESEMSDFNSTLEQAKKMAAEYKQTIDEQNAIIKAEEEKKAAEEAARKAAEEARKKAAAEAARKAAAQNSASSSSSTAPTTTASNSNANPSYSTGVSGNNVVNYACQFVGNPYVWGGTSLTNGADCSGFVMSVFANYGISLPHSSAALQSCGQEVSYANAQPGDLICYSGHVAIYMGGGQIVHAQSTAVGITTGSATYRNIVTVRRVL